MKKLIIIAMIISSTLSIVGCSLNKQSNQENGSDSTVEAKQEDNSGYTQDTSDEVKGGTLEPVNYSLSLADSTKKRCYELVNNYM